MQKVGPSREPVALATIVALAVGALASYWTGMTPELKEFLIIAGPVVIAAVWARQNVTPVPTAEADAKQAKVEGFEHGLEYAGRVTVPEDQWGINQPPKKPDAQTAGTINNTR